MSPPRVLILVTHAHVAITHNVFKISAALHGEQESQRFLVEGYPGLKSIVHYFDLDGLGCVRERWLRVTKCSTWGGRSRIVSMLATWFYSRIRKCVGKVKKLGTTGRATIDVAAV